MPDALLTVRLAVDHSMPTVGREVAILGYASMSVRDEEISDGLERFVTQRRIAFRRGIITGVYPQGNRVPWPCFELTIPVDGGMSGGPVLWYEPKYGANTPMVACGVVSRDFSPDEAKSRFTMAGCSTMAMLWPALGLAVHTTDPLDRTAQRSFLLDLVKRNIVDEVGGAATKAMLTVAANGQVTVSAPLS